MVYVGTKNTKKIRIIPEITLQALSDTGGFYFMSLYINNNMHSYIWDELPIYPWVIRRVEELAAYEEHPKIDKRHPIFEWSPGHEIIDEEIFISDYNQTLEDEDEKEMLNINNTLVKDKKFK